MNSFRRLVGTEVQQPVRCRCRVPDRLRAAGAIPLIAITAGVQGGRCHHISAIALQIDTLCQLFSDAATEVRKINVPSVAAGEGLCCICNLTKQLYEFATVTWPAVPRVVINHQQAGDRAGRNADVRVWPPIPPLFNLFQINRGRFESIGRPRVFSLRSTNLIV